jgi:hypothetical protein
MSINHKISARLLIVLSLYFLLPISCIDKLDFVGDTQEGQLVIYGLLTDINERQVVSVSRTSAFGLAPRGVQDAEVFLINESGGRSQYFLRGSGEYALEGFAALEGERYAIEVRLDDQVYRSKFEELPNYRQKTTSVSHLPKNHLERNHLNQSSLFFQKLRFRNPKIRST